MKKLVFVGILLATFVIGVMAAPIFTVLIPTIGRTSTVEITVTWQNGTEVSQINWGTVDNNTEYSLNELINITNTGDKEVTLSLSAVNQVNITAITLTWNATSPLLSGDSILVQLNQNVTASAETFGYDTRIDATG